MRLLAHSVHRGVDRLHWYGWDLKGMWRSKGNVLALMTLVLMFTQYDAHMRAALGRGVEWWPGCKLACRLLSFAMPPSAENFPPAVDELSKVGSRVHAFGTPYCSNVYPSA